jgi:DNA-binding CsgD family transcriptional regulator
LERKELAMTYALDRQLAELIKMLRLNPALAGQLPSQEREIVQLALDGQDIHQIAQQCGLSEAAVWEVLGNAARAASGQPVAPVETGGLGSDTDPGVTGGYGDTAFGSLGNEPPVPTPEEPSLGEPEEQNERA